MVAWFYIGSLAFSAVFVSLLAATFSISGLAKLFSGSALAVILMGASLEIAKFVAAAFLHRVWSHLNALYKTYMLTAVVVLSLITSMGIFGFLSDAYQSSSADLNNYTIRFEALKAERQRLTDQIDRLNKQIEEIPANRITKRAELRKENEPLIKELFGKDEKAAGEQRDMELKIVEVKNKVGPLIYIARAFNQDLDTVVKWLILVFVSVFDPLAICLVIATGEALRMRPLGLLNGIELVEAVKHEISPAETPPSPSLNSEAENPTIPLRPLPKEVPASASFGPPPVPKKENHIENSIGEGIAKQEPQLAEINNDVEVVEMRVAQKTDKVS